MNNEQIQAWAREAGFVSAEFWPDAFKGLQGCVERFATIARADLVEAHEGCKSANTMLLYEVDAIDAIKQERDDLRAEVERLTGQCKHFDAAAYKAKIEAKTLVDAAQADALRYQWLRDNSNAIHWTPSRFNKEIVSGFSFNGTGYLGFKFEEAIDAAMKGTP
jgi:hypothetical protein